ncbi:hypothetical protein, partial [Stenotrophomonas maltophilia]|uniref:hypothetical protein n=1 Tax=Stenotrophomonas maltophilia TaxID=40324 RepID=UPI001952A317
QNLIRGRQVRAQRTARRVGRSGFWGGSISNVKIFSIYPKGAQVSVTHRTQGAFASKAEQGLPRPIFWYRGTS